MSEHLMLDMYCFQSSLLSLPEDPSANPMPLGSLAVMLGFHSPGVSSPGAEHRTLP